MAAGTSPAPAGAALGQLVSVVIVNRSPSETLERCLSALGATTGVAFDVVVADDGAAAGIGALCARFPAVRLIGYPRGAGTVAAARRAIAAGGGDFVALLASHCVVTPGWLSVLLDALRGDSSIAAACSTLLWNDCPELVAARGGRLTWPGIAFDEAQNCSVAESGAGDACRETTFPSAAAMLVSRHDWKASGGFDPAFRSGGEDVDLGWRLWLLGRRVVVCRDSVVRSDGSQAEPGERPHAWGSALGLRQTIRMVAKHYPPRFLLRVLWRTLRGNLHGTAWRALAAACAWNLAHLPGTLLQRRRVGLRRSVRTEELFARGVLVEVFHPPLPPARRFGYATTDFGGWIPSPVLLPGQDSARGRLGAGWYPAQEQDGVRLRWTSGVARCSLRVAPGAEGRLRASVWLPQAGGSNQPVTMECNGASMVRRCVGGAWQELELRAQADTDGRLAVVLRSPTWDLPAPGHRAGLRLAGCGVREVRFHQQAPAEAPPSSVSVSVIIPTYNRWPILAETLAALAGQTVRELEVIVVDDGSTDGTWDSLLAWGRDHPELRLKPIRQPNLKPGRARNRALKDATGDLVLFLGDDVIPAPDLVAQHLAKHRELGESVGVLGHTDWDRSRMAVTPFLEFVNTDGPQFAYAHFRDGADILFTGFYTSNISLPRAVLGDEPFHPAFTFVDWEDIELGYRLSQRGLRLIYHASARAVHYHPTNVERFYSRQEHVGRTVGVILALHPELARSEAMPPLQPFPWYRWARHVMPAILPLLDRFDRHGRALPIWVYRNVLLCAFWTGRRRALTGMEPAVAGGATAEARE